MTETPPFSDPDPTAHATATGTGTGTGTGPSQMDTDSAVAPPEIDAPQETDTGPDTTTGTGRGNAEAAKYRRQLRAAETERDQLAGVVEGLQRAEVERIAATRLDVAADVWRFGAELSELVTDTGVIDTAKVDDVLRGILDQRPSMAARRRPQPDPSQGAGRTHSVPTWAQALKS
ncbi:hypothetical protein [Actinokineospora iranica]|uniref:Scaffolding protein n=1 Tax=Actinokineospora iranica TaxID=1271860 RepID=A0A1G6SNI5_9PSEU|nr:hypothetical protein [Actinokineospora iranica]SDD18388.1 hypothetical protein SAMN05216174_10881 [Actinokineospora iranica]